MELSEKQFKQGESEIKELTRSLFEDETWLIEKIAGEVSTSGILFFESVEGEIDEGVHAYDGFFVTPAKEVYYFEGEEEFDDELDDYKSTFKIEKIEQPEKLQKVADDFPLMRIALKMQEQ